MFRKQHFSNAKIKSFYLRNAAKPFARHIHTRTRSRSRDSSDHSSSYHFSFFDSRSRWFRSKHLVWAIPCQQSSSISCYTLQKLVLHSQRSLDFHFCRYRCWSLPLLTPYSLRQGKRFVGSQQSRDLNSMVYQVVTQTYRV